MELVLANIRMMELGQHRALRQLVVEVTWITLIDLDLLHNEYFARFAVTNLVDGAEGALPELLFDLKILKLTMSLLAADS